MLLWAHRRGLLTGHAYAGRLLAPGWCGPRPRCPYRCPGRALAWWFGYGLGLHERINLRY